jgi:hypothetical protein
MKVILFPSAILFFALSFLNVKAQNDYFLIVGSFKSLQHAEMHAENLRQAEYKLRIIHPTPEANWYRVSIYESEFFEVVKAFRLKLPKSVQSWILRLPKGGYQSLNLSDMPDEGFDIVDVSTKRSAREGTYHLIFGLYQSYQRAEQNLKWLRNGQFKDASIMGPQIIDGQKFYFISVTHGLSYDELLKIQAMYFRNFTTNIQWIEFE